MDIYNESSSSDNLDNQGDYDDVFQKRKKKNDFASTADTGKIKSGKLNSNMFQSFENFGGGGFGNLGKTANFPNMLSNFNNKDIYNINLDIDTNKYKKEDEDKDKKENIEDKKSIRESTDSHKKGFMDNIEEELGIESSVNKTPYGSKVDFTEQSQKDSKVNNKRNEIKNEEKEVEEEEYENQNEINEIKQDEGNEAQKKDAMEEYLKAHGKKHLEENNNNIQKEEIQNEGPIEEQINSNFENSRSKIEKSKLASSKVDEDDEYGGFDENINSINNIQDNLGSLLISNKPQNKIKEINNNKQTISESNTNKYLASSESKNYEGEFGESNIREINKLEDKTKSFTGGDLINQINEDHKKRNSKLEDLNSKIINKEEQPPNIYANIGNEGSKNVINSIGSGDSVNVNNIIKNEIKKYNNEIPEYKKEEENVERNIIPPKESVNINNNINNQNEYVNQYNNTQDSNQYKGKYNNYIDNNKNPYISQNNNINSSTNPYSAQNNNINISEKQYGNKNNNNQYNNKYNNSNNSYNNQFQGFTFKNDKDNKENNSFRENEIRRIENEKNKMKTDLMKLKNDEALRQERRRRETVESELNVLKEKYNTLLDEIQKMSNQKNQDFDELKINFDNAIKYNEENVVRRETQKYQNKLKDMENKYKADIIKKSNEIEKLKEDYEYLKNRYNILEQENKKIQDINEKEEEIHQLKAENYRLHEENNELRQKHNLEPDNLFKKNNNNKDNKSDTMKVYEQLLNEREINTQENLLNNYLKEIKKLNEEILFLKSLHPGNKSGIMGQKQKNNLNNVEMTLNNINYKKNNENYVINPSLQESAEKQIKKLQNYLLPSSPNDISENKMILMEKEFNRLQNKESPNEITFDSFFTVMKRLEVPLTSNELIEIFNNFPRIKGNRIRMNDFINAINSKAPSAFFLQSDPTYLNELESKLIKGQNRIKELEKFILVNNNENEEFKEQLKKSMNENKLLKNKINDLNSQILQYFLFREEKNLSNPDVIQMKEKMKNFELKSKNMNTELSEKFGKYEKKIEELKKTYEDERVNLLKEKDGYKEQINKLKNEKEKVKNDFDKKEIKYKTEIDQLNEKLLKYKKNYNILINKNENNKKEKERILNSFKDKGFDADQIMTYVNSSANIQEILNKVEDLERKNLNREEIYKKICMDVNQTHVNKELEKLKKKHEQEKMGLLKIITQKNNELNSIKSEFFGIMNELERLKANKFK